MDFTAWLVIAAVVFLVLVFIVMPSRGSGSNCCEGVKPTLSRTNRPTRRRRLSGGYYPVGYTGAYLPGEDLIEFAVWMAILNEMSDEERMDMGEYGDYGGYTEEDLEAVLFEQEQHSESVVEIVEEVTVVAPEADTFEVIEDVESNRGWGGDSDDSSSGWDSGDSDGGWDD